MGGGGRHGGAGRGIVAALVLVAWPRDISAWVSALVVAAVLWFAPAAWGQAGAEAYEGRPIARVLIKRSAGAGGEAGGAGGGERALVDLDGRSAQRALNNIRSQPGAPYRAEVVRGDVARLNRLNAYDGVETLAQLRTDGAVDLIFVLEPQRLIVDVQVTGNRAVTDQQLLLVVDILINTPIDRFQIDRSARRIEEVYREKGYYLAQVTVDESALAEERVVLFRIREGERVKITEIRFEGNVAFGASRLLRQVQTREGGVFRRGAIDDVQLDADVGALVEFYREQGYLDVRADRTLTPSPNGREAILTFLIEEGELYVFRGLRVEYIGEGREGFDPVYSPEQIAGLLVLKPGGVYGAREVEQSVQNVRRAYGQLGFADAIVQRADLRDTERPLVDMLLRVSPGPRYLTGEVIIAGTDLTQTKVPRQFVELVPDRPLDTVRRDQTEEALRRLQLFNQRRLQITFQEPDLSSSIYRDVLIEVEETNTGSFDLGGAVSTDSGVLGRIALTQRNFDVADVPDSIGELFSGRAFRGGGQTFALELSPGDEIETYSLSLSDPTLLDSDYSGSAQISFRDRDFDEFEERRFGGRFGLGRRLGTRWTGRVGLRVESIEISGFSPSDPTDFFDSEGENVLIGIGPTLSRSTINNLFRPSRGSVTELGVEAVGGDFNFQRISGAYSVFFPLREDFDGRATVLSLQTRVGYIPQDRDEVPVFERFFQGGNEFRGFEFRTISPRGVANDSGLPSATPVGGTFSFFAGAEITQPLFGEIFAVAAFVDSGTVSFEPEFNEYRVSVGVGVRISVPQLSPAPLAFDFGFPVIDVEGDEERLFSFSISLPFR